jgi:HEAT repeat
VAVKSNEATDPNDEVEFHEAIKRMIPLFIKLLEDGDWAVRFESVEVVGKLANYGER